MNNTFPVSRYVMRVRREADLSQRELALQCGVSASLIARVETDASEIATDLFSRVLGLAGFRLAVVDRDGREVEPVPADTLRDNAGRRFPAHLDVDAPDEVPSIRVLMPRYDRLPARGWYRLREERDRQRAENGRPADHLTQRDLRARARADKEARARVRRLLAASAPPRRECECEAECWLGTVCARDCTCQCEPARAEARD